MSHDNNLEKCGKYMKYLPIMMTDSRKMKRKSCFYYIDDNLTESFFKFTVGEFTAVILIILCIHKY